MISFCYPNQFVGPIEHGASGYDYVERSALLFEQSGNYTVVHVFCSPSNCFQLHNASTVFLPQISGGVRTAKKENHIRERIVASFP